MLKIKTFLKFGIFFFGSFFLFLIFPKFSFADAGLGAGQTAYLYGSFVNPTPNSTSSVINNGDVFFTIPDGTPDFLATDLAFYIDSTNSSAQDSFVQFFVVRGTAPNTQVIASSTSYSNLAVDHLGWWGTNLSSRPILFKAGDHIVYTTISGAGLASLTFKIVQPYIEFKNNVGNIIDLKFLYPQDSAITYIHDFSDFTFSAQNLDTDSHVFRFSVIYDTTSTLDQNPIKISRGVDYLFSTGAIHYLGIPKPQPLATSTQYWASLCYSYDSNSILNCESPITFVLGVSSQIINTSQAGFFGASSTEAAILFNNILPPLDESQYCPTEFYDPASWFCRAGVAIRQGLNQLGEYAGAGIARIASTTADVYPMSVFFALNGDIQALTSTTTDPIVEFQGQGNAFKKATGGYYTFVILSSSTTHDASTKGGFDWEALVVYIIYAGDGIIILITSALLLHKSAHHVKK